MTNPVTVRRVESAGDLAEAKRIRLQVFVREQGIPESADDDGLDAEAIHVLGIAEDRPAGTGRVVVRGRQAVISRIAVLPGHRGCGLGRALIANLEQIAGSLGARRVVLHPHARLEQYYGGLGYATIPGGQVVGDNVLITMEKVLG